MDRHYMKHENEILKDLIEAVEKKNISKESKCSQLSDLFKEKSTIEVMKPLQEYNNLLQEYRKLEGMILTFYLQLDKIDIIDEAFVFIDDVEIKEYYKKWFNITTERHGKSNNAGN